MSKRRRDPDAILPARASSALAQFAGRSRMPAWNRRNGGQLTTLVRDYVRYYRQCRLFDLKFYRSLPELRDAINKAALGERQDGKRHAHQRRIRRKVMEEVKEKLLKRTRKLSAAHDFDEIHSIVQNCSVPGFGPLSAYDTALRIGVWLRKPPKKVYLHAGVTIGARGLGLDPSDRYILGRKLPPGLPRLDAGENKDSLCIHKDQRPEKPARPPL